MAPLFESESTVAKSTALDEKSALDKRGSCLDGNVEAGVEQDSIHEYADEFAETKDLKRGLKQRHISMIALAGTIGTGLFLASGKSIARGGPVGAFLAYSIIGVIVSGVVISIAELNALVPLSGGIVRPAEFFFDPALSFAQGWNTVYATAMLLPAETVACAVLIDFWTHINHAVWIIVLGALLFVSNTLFVGIYGELEFIFAILKILLVFGTNIMGLVIDLGGAPNHQRLGSQYWRNPGPFVQYLGIDGRLGQFLGFWKVLGSAYYAYSGVENISVAAAETQSPRRNIPQAAKKVFYRVLIFYVISILIVSMIVPYNDKRLAGSNGDASASPFVISAVRAGITAVPSIINAVVLTSAWSAGNSAMLGGSRVLYGLAQERLAPRLFLKVNRFGIPWVAKQGISRDELPWKGPFQPYAAWLALITFSILLVTSGYTVFVHGHWDAQTFVSNYFNIPLIFALFFGAKFAWKTKFVSLQEMPIRKFIQIANDNPEEPEVPKTGWRKWNILW